MQKFDAGYIKIYISVGITLKILAYIKTVYTVFYITKDYM